MNKIRFTLKAFAFLAFTLACASAAHAQATRTWVSGVGDDVNPCSRTAPCKTFAGAISKTADGGEIDCVDPGGFGTVTITKSITIDGGGTFASILASGTNGVNVNDSASGAANTKVVTLRNLSINGAGTTLGINGINFTSAKTLNVEHCQIFNFSSNAINMATSTATEMYLSDVSIFNSTQGVRLTSTSGFAAAFMNRVNINHMFGTSSTGNGIRLETNGILDIRDSEIAFSPASGINIAAGALSANIINTTIMHANVGITAAAGTSRIADSSVILNVTGVAFSGGTLRTFGNNNFDGNSTPFSGGAMTAIGGTQ